MEGIMMRGPQTTAMAVRDPDGVIVLEKWETTTKKRSKITKLPLIRGVFGFADSMITGYKCLMRSAEISGLEELEKEAEAEKRAKKAAKAAKKAAKRSAKENATEAFSNQDVKADIAPEADDVAPDIFAPEPSEVMDDNKAENEGKKDKKKKEKEDSSLLMPIVMIIGTVLGIGLAIVLFVALPTYLYRGLEYLFHFLKTDNSALNSLIKSVFEGILKIAILVGYMALVSMMKEIRKTFQYHGAEHKTIFCYENGLPLTVENVRKQRRFHPRCGTSFLILMLIVSIFISFFIDPIFIALTGAIAPTIIRTLLKLIMIPLMMGIGYELIKFAGRHDNLLTRIISAPGMWLQHITVREPDDSMIECAITAFKEVIPPEERDEYDVSPTEDTQSAEEEKNEDQ